MAVPTAVGISSCKAPPQQQISTDTHATLHESNVNTTGDFATNDTLTVELLTNVKRTVDFTIPDTRTVDCAINEKRTVDQTINSTTDDRLNGKTNDKRET